jgi:hypothetical protein
MQKVKKPTQNSGGERVENAKNEETDPKFRRRAG